MMNREEIIKVYEQGPEAVIALVESLFAIIERQQAQIAQQQEQIHQLTVRVKDLEDRLALNSRNSSQPPSGDAPGQRTKSLRTASGKKPGAQKGHPGRRLQAHPQPDRILRHSPPACHQCGQSLEAVVGTEHEEPRQVFDLPPIKLEVTEHCAISKVCPSCQALNHGQFPAEVAPGVQYGPQLKALGVYLVNYQLLPWRRTCELISDLTGQWMAAGTLAAALTECAHNLESSEGAIKEALKQATLAHFDETGLYVADRRQWLHVSSTALLTHYGFHPKRGSEATKQIGILPAFKGRAIHDHFSPYFKYQCDHGLCNAHHLRELTFIHEQQHQAWAGKLKRLLVKIKRAVELAAATGAQALPTSQQRKFERAYDCLITQGLQLPENRSSQRTGKRGPAKQSKAKNLLDRLSEYKRETLAFMSDFAIPFDNNQAERDLRMIKVQQKISGCFRTEAGATAFCRIRSYISTIKKQGRHVLSAIKSALAGHPLFPVPGG
jgi:transposase